MSQSSHAGADGGPDELSESDRHLLLSVERRRVALDVLASGPTMLSLDDLAVAVAEREVDEPVAPEESVERVAISLHHNHLPKLEEYDVIDYYPAERLVIKTPQSRVTLRGTTRP